MSSATRAASPSSEQRWGVLLLSPATLRSGDGCHVCGWADWMHDVGRAGLLLLLGANGPAALHCCCHRHEPHRPYWPNLTGICPADPGRVCLGVLRLRALDGVGGGGLGGGGLGGVGGGGLGGEGGGGVGGEGLGGEGGVRRGVWGSRRWQGWERSGSGR